MNFIMGKDDEFEDEPEDELASAGMHIVENDEADDEDAKIKEDEEVPIDAEIEETEDEKKEDSTEAFEEALDGLKELEELEKSVLSPLTFGGDDEA